MTTNYIKHRDRHDIIMERLDLIETQYEKLPPGIYISDDISRPFTPTVISFIPITLKEDLIKFKTGAISTVIDKCTHFFSPNVTAMYKQMGMAHKMGILMYGPPGTGKTCTVQLIMSELVRDFNAVCIDFTGDNPDWIKLVCHKIRDIQDNPIVIFLDEAENSLHGKEEKFLAFLDGTESIDNSIFIGCTNFFNKIPKRIRERRSRIKLAIEIKALPIEVYKDYIRSKMPHITDRELSKFAYLAEENALTIDELKHAVIDHCIDCVPVDKAIKTVKEYSEQDNWSNEDDY